MERATKDIDNAVKKKQASISIGTEEKGKGIFGGIKQKAMNIVPESFQPLLKVLAPLALLGLLVKSSQFLMNTLRGIMRAVMLIVKPIGDIIGIGLRPIVDILRPIGMIFRTLFQPYLRKAMEAMRLGRMQLKAGNIGEAMEAYATGELILLKPFFNIMVKSSESLINIILSGIELLGTVIAKALDFMTLGAFNLEKGWHEAMKGARETVTAGADAIISETDKLFDTMLLIAEEKAVSVGNEFNTMWSSLLDSLGTNKGVYLSDHQALWDGVNEDFTRRAIITLSNIDTTFQGILASGDLFGQLRDNVTDKFRETVNAVNEQIARLTQNTVQTTVVYDSKGQPMSGLGGSGTYTSPAQSAIEKLTALPEPFHYPTSTGGTSSMYNTETSTGGDIVGTLSGMWDWVSSILGLQVGTPFVPQTGMYTLHRGEAVIPAGHAQKMEREIIVRDVNVNLGGVKVSSDYDVDRMLRLIDERVRDVLMTEVSR